MSDSYDVFETCLVRKVADPHQVFDEVGSTCGLDEGFRYRRAEAEIEANRQRGCDASLEDIYRVLATWGGWTDERRQQVMEAELAVESAQLVPVSALVGGVARSRQKHGEVVFLSDMYLPPTFIEERLRHFGFFCDGDRLLVSSVEGVSKHRGDLYGRAAVVVGKPLTSHTGNHPRADGLKAKEAGLKVRLFLAGNLSRYEERMNRSCDPVSRGWAGLSRWARLSGEAAQGSEEEALFRVSAGVGGPLVLAYAAWLVEQAASRGLRSVYFLARDGQCLLEPFRKIAAARGLEVEARYLYASRIAWRFPREFPLTDEALAGILQHSHLEIPLEVVAARLGVDCEELRDWIPNECFGGEGLKRAKADQIRSALASSEPARRLQQVADDRDELFIAYLRQEGVLDSAKVAVVDLGWGGSLQAGLVETLMRAGEEVEVLGLYLALNRLPEAPAMQTAAMLFDPSTRAGRGGPWLTALSECICQADTGTTLGFRRNEEGVVVPTLDDPDGMNPRVPNWLSLHRQVMDRFVDGVIAEGLLPRAPSSYGRLLCELMQDFWMRPEKDEAVVWGDIHFATHGLASTMAPLAPRPNGLVDLAWALGSGALGYGQAVWRQGSAVRLPGSLGRFGVLSHRIRNRFQR